MKFRKVESAELLAIKLDNIFIRDQKLFAKIPRFKRESRNRMEIRKEDMHRKDSVFARLGGTSKDVNVKQSKPGEVGKPKVHSYANVVRGRGLLQNAGLVDQVKKRRNTIGWFDKEKMPRFAHLKFDVTKENISRFEKAFVGVVETPSITYNIQDMLYKEGFFGIQVTPLGANLCLLEENMEAEIKAGRGVEDMD